MKEYSPNSLTFTGAAEEIKNLAFACERRIEDRPGSSIRRPDRKNRDGYRGNMLHNISFNFTVDYY